MSYIAIKQAWGWTIKEYDNKVPDNKFYRIFETHEAAEEYIDKQTLMNWSDDDVAED